MVDKVENEEKEPMEITTRDAIVEVRKTVFGKEEVANDRIRIRPFISTPASVSVKAGITINLGNYESGRVDVMLTIPCYLEEVDSIYEDAKSWVDGRVEHEKKEIESAIGRS